MKQLIYFIVCGIILYSCQPKTQPTNGTIVNAELRSVIDFSNNPDAIAVGRIGDFNVSDRLLEHIHNNNLWKQEFSQALPPQFEKIELNAISGKINEFVVAGGEYKDGFFKSLLVYSTGDNHWKNLITPNQGVQLMYDNFYTGISFTDKFEFWVVGWYIGASSGFHPAAPIIYYFKRYPNFQYRTFQPAMWKLGALTFGEDTDTTSNVGLDCKLLAVCATSKNDAWAVGKYNDVDSLRQLTLRAFPFIQHFDGVRWSYVQCEVIDSCEQELLCVSGSSSKDVWTGGKYTRGNSTHMVLEHWNGSNWNLIDLNDNYWKSEINGIISISPTDVWIVGSANNGALTMHWDGNDWTRITNDYESYGGTNLLSVSASSSKDVWAVGRWNQNTISLHWDGVRWKPYQTI